MKKSLRSLLCSATALAFTGSAVAEPPKVELGGFADAYYAFDFNDPPARDRLFTTSPARHNEFALNLAYLEAKVSADRYRGRVALQAGTSVLANYSSEYRDPTKTGVQLADVLMHVQEAYAGYRVADGLWIDAGTFFSHVGSESFISKDNWAYTRSLVADFSPYYQSGVKLTWDPSSAWTLQLHLMNGWQNLVETNGDKAVGTQVVYRAGDRWTFTYNTLVGRETELRLFQDFIVKFAATAYWESSLVFDVGLQKRGPGAGFATWWGTSWQNRFRLGEVTSLNLRAEYYRDPEQKIVTTATPNGFSVWGASANFDWQLLPQLVWRNELRLLHSTDAIYPGRSGAKPSTVFGVTSLGISF